MKRMGTHIRKTILTLSLIVFILTSCKKEAIDFNPDFEGTWKATCCEIFIPSDGKGYYDGFTDNGAAIKVTGKVKITKDEKELKIGLKKFNIDEFPHEIIDTINSSASGWFMTIESKEYKRQ